MNRLFIENVKLKEQLKGAGPFQSIELIVYQHPTIKNDIGAITIEQVNVLKQEIEKLKKTNEEIKERAKRETLKVLE